MARQALRGRSLRFRITLAATAIVTLAVVAGSMVFVVVLRGALHDGVVSAAETDALSVATRIEQAGFAAVADEEEVDDRFFQVIDDTGRVVASSPDASTTPVVTLASDEVRTIQVDGVPFVVVTLSSEVAQQELATASPSSTPSPSPSESEEDSDDDDGNSGNGNGDDSDDPGDDDSEGGNSGDDSDEGNSGKGNSGNGDNSGDGSDGGDSGKGRGGNSGKGGGGMPLPPALSAVTSPDYLVVAGRSTVTATETIDTVIRLLAIAVPLLILIVAMLSWFTVARALRPVDRMRAELDEVTATNLDRRIADPGSADPRKLDEIGRLALTMNRMLDRLDESQRAQRRFVSDASHELKSPLASLRQFAEVSTAHPDRITQGELSDAVLDEGARLERLVQGMLVLARADEHALAPASESVDLDDLLLSEARRVRASGGVSVDSSKVAAARITGDEAMLAQVVRNLVDNAVRHAESAVALEVVPYDDVVVIAVEDDGAGVALEERDRVFDRFVRLDEARSRESGGSGLGLSIVQELVRAHGGTVRVVDAGLGGARFEVRLPATAAS